MKHRAQIVDLNRDLFQHFYQKNIFLTGGTGFFGKSFLDLFISINLELDLNCKVTILTRDSKTFKKNFCELVEHKFIEFIEGDICSFPFPDKSFDYILHFATPASSSFNKEKPAEVFQIITEGTKHVLEFAKICNVKKILFASSGAIYGSHPLSLVHIDESYVGDDFHTQSYGEGKRVAEALGISAAFLGHFEFKIARCFTFAGPYLDPKSEYAIANFVRDAVLSHKIVIHSDGRDYRSYMGSDDLVVALLTILTSGKNGKPYNVGSDDPITIRELAYMVKDLVNPDVAIEILDAVNKNSSPKSYIPSIDLLKNELNYVPTMTLSESS
jgi:dTDP-glucose 4,6-dehydratase